jgi:hypothetical protein
MSDAYARKLAAKSGKECRTHPTGDAAAWSMQDVIEHLVLTYRGTIVQTEKYLQRGVPTQKKAGLPQILARTLVVGLGRFPPNVKAPEFVLPGRGEMAEMDGNALATLLRDELSRLDRQLTRCEQTFGEGRLAPHFRFGPLSAREWRKFHLVHGRHHLKQLSRIEAKLSNRPESD